MLNKETINLPFMLMQMADELFPAWEAKGQKVDIDSPEGVTLYGDADKLARVFNNILKNAIAYGDQNTAIQISVSVSEGWVSIRFVNQGRTIPKDRLGNLFDRFFRLDAARSSDSGGAGLGLAIAKEIVTAHGGMVEAQSVQGITAFTVTLPRYAEEEGERKKNFRIP